MPPKMLTFHHNFSESKMMKFQNLFVFTFLHKPAQKNDLFSVFSLINKIVVNGRRVKMPPKMLTFHHNFSESKMMKFQNLFVFTFLHKPAQKNDLFSVFQLLKQFRS